MNEKDYLDEIDYLHRLLDAHQIPYRSFPEIKEKPACPLPALANDGQYPGLFHSYFHGRDDLCALRHPAGGYYRACASRFDAECPKNSPDYQWKPGKKSLCSSCTIRQDVPVTARLLMDHFEGKRTVGIYPLLEDNTVRLLAFDFDDHEKKDVEDCFHQAGLLGKTLEEQGFSFLRERSRSGNGAHLWLFFSEPVAVEEAAKFGRLLLLQSAKDHGMNDFSAFDRLIPYGKPKIEGSAGTAVGLPLQKDALKQGNSLFTDENWNPYPDQWQALASTKKIDPGRIRGYFKKTKESGLEKLLDPQKTDASNKQPVQDLQLFFCGGQNLSLDPADYPGKLSVILKDGIHIPAAHLSEKAQTNLLLLGCYWNPEYQKRSSKNASGPRILVHSRKENGEIILPRGLLENLEDLLRQAGIEYEIIDQRNPGQRVEAMLTIDLYDYQKTLVDQLMKSDLGILQAVTGSGKTVMGAAMIARAKTSALVIVEKQPILEGWIASLNSFLKLDPSAETSSVRYPGQIGVLQGTNDSLSGRIDVAMKGSLVNRKDLKEILSGYGMVLVDECHHAGAAGYQKVLDAVSSKRVYGLSATPDRPDQRNTSLYWQLGPVAAAFTSKDQMKNQTFERIVIPRFTRFLSENPQESDFMRICQEAACDPSRNERIIKDALDALDAGRKVLILTRLVDHASVLAQRLSEDGRQVLLLAGSSKDKKQGKAALDALDPKKPTILVGTYQAVGEGFDYALLDTLLLALPVRSSISISQAIGRIHRQSEGKLQALVYDYADVHIPMLENMYRARLREYRKQGYRIESIQSCNQQLPSGGCFYQNEDYLPLFFADLASARRKIVICVRSIDQPDFDRLINGLMPALERGVHVFLYMEETDENMAAACREQGIVFHGLPRIVGRYVLIDQEIVWYGSLLSENRGSEGVLRLNSPEAAEDLFFVLHSQLERQKKSAR